MILGTATRTILYKNTVITTMSVSLAPELYYLSNFRTALAWVAERYADLLADEERAFLDTINTLPWPSQALLVRMISARAVIFV